MEDKIKELKKRINHLDVLLTQKKSIVENELFQVENICKELIKLKDQLEKLESNKKE